MGTSNFNVRRNSSVMPVFTDEDVLGSFEQYKADFLDNIDDDDDASNYDIEAMYYDDSAFAYESAVDNFLEDNIKPKMYPIFEDSGKIRDANLKIRGTVELFSSAYIDVYVNVKTEIDYYEGVTFGWDVVIETSSGIWYDCLEYFKEDFCYDDLIDMTGEEGDAVDFAVPIIIKMVEDKVDEMTYNEMNKGMISIINSFLRTREDGVYYPDGALNIGNGSADVDEIRQLKNKSGFEVIRRSHGSSIVIATNSSLLIDESFRILSHIFITEDIYVYDSYDVCEVYEGVLDRHLYNNCMPVDEFISSICMPNLTDNQISEVIARLKDGDGTKPFDSVLAKDCNWLELTDPDPLQFRRDIDIKNGVYVYYQLDSSCVNLDTVTVGGDISSHLCIEAVIDLSKYSDDDKSEALQSFGYSQTWSCFCREHGLKTARDLISKMIFENSYL